MTASKRTLLVLATVALGLIAFASVASAQTTDVFRINYISNNVWGAPDATVRIDNPGVTGGNLCAMIYVFDNDQQLSECCGCLETPNGLRTLSVAKDLTSNPLTGYVVQNGVLKVVSSAVNNSPCDPSANVAPTATLRVWATHIQNPVYATAALATKAKTVANPSAYPITETESSNSTLGATELANIQAECAFIGILGSGHGICSCGWGD
jgi:hypothetical protein